MENDEKMGTNLMVFKFLRSLEILFHLIVNPKFAEKRRCDSPNFFKKYTWFPILFLNFFQKIIQRYLKY